MPAMLWIIVWLVIVGVAAWGAMYILQQLPPPEPINKILRVVIIVVAVLFIIVLLLSALGALGGPGMWPRFPAMQP